MYTYPSWLNSECVNLEFTDCQNMETEVDASERVECSADEE